MPKFESSRYKVSPPQCGKVSDFAEIPNANRDYAIAFVASGIGKDRGINFLVRLMRVNPIKYDTRVG